MRLALALALVAAPGLVGVACGHTHAVTDAPTTSPPPAGAETEPSAPKVVTKSRGRSGGPEDRRLPTSPGDELAPGGVDKIQARLVANGALAPAEATGRLDATTEGALRGFQRSRHLPATGAPDDATVGALGLKSEDVFRRDAR